MIDDPSVYINPDTPGYTTAYVYPSGTPFGILFDEAFDPESDRPGLACAERVAAGMRARDTVLIIKEKTYTVMADPYLDGMGLATVQLQER